MRIGILSHFDLRIKAGSDVGLAITKAFKLDRLTDTAGEDKILSELKLDQTWEQDNQR